MATQTAPTYSSSSSPPSVSSNGGASQAFVGIGNLLRLLPTGTVFFYQFMNPITTNNGSCSTSNKYVSSVLFAICAISCFLSTFTDSYHDNQGNIHYGIATFKGFWPTSSDAAGNSSVDFRFYRIQIGDFVHAFLSLTVFCVLSLLDTNTVHCFYPSFQDTEKALMMALPPVIGSVAATIFSSFPMRRHGIGYPETSPSQPPSSSSSPSSAVVPAAASGPQTPSAEQKA